MKLTIHVPEGLIDDLEKEAELTGIDYRSLCYHFIERGLTERQKLRRLREKN